MLVKSKCFTLVSFVSFSNKIISDIIINHCDKGGAAIISTHVDLNLPKSKILDINSFKPSVGKEIDPFLKGNF